MPREATGRKVERDTCFFTIALFCSLFAIAPRLFSLSEKQARFFFLDFSLSGSLPMGKMSLPAFPMNENIFLIVITFNCEGVYIIKIINFSFFPYLCR